MGIKSESQMFKATPFFFTAEDANLAVISAYARKENEKIDENYKYPFDKNWKSLNVIVVLKICIENALIDLNNACKKQMLQDNSLQFRNHTSKLVVWNGPHSKWKKIKKGLGLK